MQRLLACLVALLVQTSVALGSFENDGQVSSFHHDAAVKNAKRELDVAKARQATASAKEEASAEIAKDFSWKAGTEKGKAEAYKEGYFKAKGRLSADNHMKNNLVAMRHKEGTAKKTLRARVQKLAGTPNAVEKHGKTQLQQHEGILHKIRQATQKAFGIDKTVGVAQVKVDKLKTKEKVLKIKNGRISHEMKEDEHALSTAKKLHGEKGATKEQKLAAMKGEVRGLMFLKALNSKATGALATVHELKKTLARQKLNKVSSATAPAAKAPVAKAPAAPGAPVVMSYAALKKSFAKKSKQTNTESTGELAAMDMAKQDLAHTTASAPGNALLSSSLVLLEDEAAPAYFGELEGTARTYAKTEGHAARFWKQELESTHEGTMKLRTQHKPCDCNGVSNRHQHGAHCKDWEADGTAPWCYVTWACSKGTPARQMQGVKWATCHALKKEAAKADDRQVVPLTVDDAARKEATASVVSTEHESARTDKNPMCVCTGTKNGKGQGHKCAVSGYSEPWCYVSIQCDRGYVSNQVVGSKWTTGCQGGQKLLGETSHETKLSLYHREKEELGEALEETGQGLTRPGWSWGLVLASNSQYPRCIEDCKSNPACVGATYAVNDVPSHDPAAPPLQANTCHLFSGITEKNENMQWQTWLSPHHQ